MTVRAAGVMAWIAIELCWGMESVIAVFGRADAAREEITQVG